jgi:hypothetical protein
MGQENSGADQTHYCRHGLKHYQGPLRHCATENAATLHSQKDFRAPIRNPDRRGLWATDVYRLVIQRQEFVISRHAGDLTFMTVMRLMKQGG